MLAAVVLVAVTLAAAAVSFSMCLVSVSTLACRALTSSRLGTPMREIALLRRLSKASSNSLHLPSANSLTSSTLERVDVVALGPEALVSFSAFSPSLTRLSNSLLPSASIFEYTPKPASQILREYSSTLLAHVLLSFAAGFLAAIVFPSMRSRDVSEPDRRIIKMNKMLT